MACRPGVGGDDGLGGGGGGAQLLEVAPESGRVGIPLEVVLILVGRVHPAEHVVERVLAERNALVDGVQVVGVERPHQMRHQPDALRVGKGDALVFGDLAFLIVKVI